jgi:hypothetical protein
VADPMPAWWGISSRGHRAVGQAGGYSPRLSSQTDTGESPTAVRAPIEVKLGGVLLADRLADSVIGGLESFSSAEPSIGPTD